MRPNAANVRQTWESLNNLGVTARLKLIGVVFLVLAGVAWMEDTLIDPASLLDALNLVCWPILGMLGS